MRHRTPGLGARRALPAQAVACLLALAAPAIGATVEVSAEQDLINVANKARPGDILRVEEGEYSGGVLEGRDVTILGQGSVHLRGRVTLTGGGVVLHGLTWKDQDSQLLDIRSARNTVRKCVFRRFGRAGPSKAIWIRESGDYSHNTIEDCLFEDWGGTTYHSSCIKIGQHTNRDAHRGTVVRNCVFRRGAVGGNSPAIQPFCPSLIEGNVIHDCEDGIETKGSNMVVRNNVVYRCSGGEAMSNRSGSNNLFEGNLLYDIPTYAWQIWTGGNNVWRNNVVVSCGRIAHIKGGSTSSGRAADVLLINNTFVNNERGISWHNREFAPVGVRVVNNIFVGRGTRPVIESPRQGDSVAEYTEDYNLVDGYSPPAGRACGPHTIMGKAPLFTDPGERDFRLLRGSPGTDAGLTDPALVPATDRAGTPRPQGSGVDMGAFERGPE